MTTPITTQQQIQNLTSEIALKLNKLFGLVNLNFQGLIAISDTPTDAGFYFPTESGTYSNAGNTIVDLSEGLTILSYDGVTWGKQVVPVDLVATGIIEEGETLAVSGDAVWKKINKLFTKNVFTLSSENIESGDITTDEFGKKTPSPERLRTINRQVVSNIFNVKINLPEGFEFSIIEYLGDEVIKNSGWLESGQEVSCNNAYNVVLRKEDNSNIATEELNEDFILEETIFTALREASINPYYFNDLENGTLTRSSGLNDSVNASSRVRTKWMFTFPTDNRILFDDEIFNLGVRKYELDETFTQTIPVEETYTGFVLEKGFLYRFVILRKDEADISPEDIHGTVFIQPLSTYDDPEIRAENPNLTTGAQVYNHTKPIIDSIYKEEVFELTNDNVEKGGFNQTTGLKTPFSTGLRTINRQSFLGQKSITVNLPEGFQFSIRGYNQGNYVFNSGWIAQGIPVNWEGVFNIVIRKEDDSNSEVADIGEESSVVVRIDKVEIGIPIKNIFIEDIEQGAMFTATGTNIGGSSSFHNIRVRVISFIHSIKTEFRLNFDSDIAVRLFKYNLDQSFIGIIEPTTNGILLEQGFLWRFTVSKIDNQEPITPEEVEGKIWLSASSRNSASVDITSEINNVITRNYDIQPAVDAAIFNHYYDSISGTAKRFNFLHFSDNHSDNKATQNIIDYLDKTPQLDFAISTGDTLASNFTSSKSALELMALSNKPIYNVIGNHDVGSHHEVSRCATQAEAYATFIEPFEEKTEKITNGKSYWYKDFEDRKIRMIGLYEYDSPEDLDPSDSTRYRISRRNRVLSQEQVDWFLDTLDDTPSDYHLMVLLHQSPGGTNPSIVINTSWNTFNEDVPTPFNHIDGDIIPDIINAWINGLNFSETYSLTGDADYLPDLNVIKDFSIRGAGTFIGYFFGHHHRDIMGVFQKYPDQNCFSLICATRDDERNKFHDVPRVPDRKSEDAFHVIGVDTDLKKVFIVRVGANYTYDLNVRKTLVVNY